MKWIGAILSTSDDEILRCAGLDGLTFVLFLRFGFKVTIFGSLMGTSLLLPTYASADRGLQGYEALTIANVASGDRWRPWVSLSFMGAYIAFILGQLWILWRTILPLRYAFLASGDGHPGYRYTVCVENVPEMYRTNHNLRAYFEKLFPREVVGASLILSTPELDELCARRDKAVIRLENVNARKIAYPQAKPKTVKVTKAHCGGVRENAVVHYSREAEEVGTAATARWTDIVSLCQKVDTIALKWMSQQPSVVSSVLHHLDPRVLASSSYLQNGGIMRLCMGSTDQSDSEEPHAPLPGPGKMAGDSSEISRWVYSSQRSDSQLSSHCLYGAETTRPSATALSPAPPPPCAGSPQSWNIVVTRPADFAGKTQMFGSSVSTRLGIDTEAERQLRLNEGLSASMRSELEEWRKISTSTAHVMFSSLVAKTVACQVELGGKASFMETSPAPKPKDIIWKNMSFNLDVQRKFKFLAMLFWCAGIIFWAIPVAFVQAVANIDELSKRLPWIVFPSEENNPFLYGLIKGYLPVIALQLLMILVPIVIRLVALKFVRLKSETAVSVYVFVWHFGFQVANLWLSLIGGSLFNQLDTILNEPLKLPRTIARAVPKSSQFFLNSLISEAFASVPMTLSQLPRLALFVAMSSVIREKSLSQRQLDARMSLPSFNWGTDLPPIIFILLVAFVYVVIVPIILPFAALFFAIAYVTYTYQSLYVVEYTKGGGEFFYPLYTMVMSCLYMSEIIFTFYLSIAGAAVQAPISFFFVPLTIYVDLRIRTNFYRPSNTLALQVAREVDDEVPFAAPVTGQSLEGGMEASLLSIAAEYLQPSLNRSQWLVEPQPYRRENSLLAESNGREDSLIAESVGSRVSGMDPEALVEDGPRDKEHCLEMVSGQTMDDGSRSSSNDQ